MKGLVFVIAVALACCVTTCTALTCPTCTLADTRAACMQASQVTCNQTNPYCYTIQSKTSLAGEKWVSRCGTKSLCDAGKITNRVACKPTETTSNCIYCCNTDGCVGQPGSGTSAAVSVSVITMATAVMAVLLKNAAGF